MENPEPVRLGEEQILRTVMLAYHVTHDLLEHEAALRSEAAAVVANGLLIRLRRAWADRAEYLAVLADLPPVSIVAKTKRSEATPVHPSMDGLLTVLHAACRALLTESQPERGRFGFDPASRETER